MMSTRHSPVSACELTEPSVRSVTRHYGIACVLERQHLVMASAPLSTRRNFRTMARDGGLPVLPAVVNGQVKKDE